MYDAIVVGARVAGSAAALLLARRGMKVLLVDKASFPSDTLSTHYIHQSGIARMKRWGLLERLHDSGCPPIEEMGFDFGPFGFRGTPSAAPGGVTAAYAPRRTVLDKMLIDAAVEAGCEFRERYGVEGLISNDGRVMGILGRAIGGSGAQKDQADVVIGADGMHSVVARLVDAPFYHTRPALSCVYYTYLSGLSTPSVQLEIRPKHTVLSFPTHEGWTVAVVSWPISEFPRIKLDHEKAFLDTLPDRLRAGRTETRVVGTADLANFYRKPYGPGWALVGDAGHHKDPISAQGVSDAFRDADQLSAALTGGGSREAQLAAYEERRNAETMAMYEMTCQRASYESMPEEMMVLLQAVARNPEAANQFCGIDAGTVRVEEFFHPANVQRIVAGLHATR